MPKLRKARHLSLVENVTHQIQEAILDGEYQPGDKLPPTRQLQNILGASLGTIRESLAILEQRGLLAVRKGAKGGFFIREATTEPMTESLELLMRRTSLSPEELYEFRATVEAGLIRLVVQRATEDQLAVFAGYLDKFKACLNKGQPGWLKLVETEQALRREFLKAIQNRTYEAVLLPIYNNLIQYALRYLPGGDAEAFAAYDYWVKIIPAVAARDEDRAARLMQAFLFHFRDRILNRSENN